MSIRTQRVASFDDDSVVLSFDWDDATGNVSAVRCVNNTQRTAWVRIVGLGTGPSGRTREATFNPGTTVVNIPGGQQPRYTVAQDENGIATVSGYDVFARFPA